MSDNRSLDILLEMKKNFFSERQEILLRIQSIENKIAHAKAQLDTLNKREDSDFAIFSPRSNAGQYELKIAEKEKEISSLEDDLRSEYKKLSNVTKQLDSLDLVKSSEIMTVGEQKPEENVPDPDIVSFDRDSLSEIVSVLKNEISSVLSSVSSDISLSEKLIDKDPYRVRQTLNHDVDLLSKGLKDLNDILKKLEN